MKYLNLIILTILFFPVSSVFAQDENKWLRIETDDKELSVAFPQTNIIDTEKREFGQRLRVIAFENGIEIEIKISKDGEAKGRIGRMYDGESAKSGIFQFDDFLIRKIVPVQNGKNFIYTFLIVKKDSFYYLTVRAKTGEEPEVVRFLTSIKLGGKPLIVQKEPANFPEQTLAISALKTSPEIVEAFDRKTGKNKGAITYQLESKDTEDTETEDLTHRAVVLDRPFPRYRPPFRSGIVPKNPITVKLKVQFLADGQIGDIVVLSNPDKSFTRSTIDAVRKTVFIPARRGGVDVDSFKTVSFSAQAFFTEQIIIR